MNRTPPEANTCSPCKRRNKKQLLVTAEVDTEIGNHKNMNLLGNISSPKKSGNKRIFLRFTARAEKIVKFDDVIRKFYFDFGTRQQMMETIKTTLSPLHFHRLVVGISYRRLMTHKNYFHRRLVTIMITGAESSSKLVKTFCT